MKKKLINVQLTVGSPTGQSVGYYPRRPSLSIKESSIETRQKTAQKSS
jgi:hypothetical protein